MVILFSDKPKDSALKPHLRNRLQTRLIYYGPGGTRPIIRKLSMPFILAVHKSMAALPLNARET